LGFGENNKGMKIRLNSPHSEIGAKWTTEARRRLAGLRSGKIDAVPGEAVFERILERFNR
jgi:hypothetical protein